jgi:signal recognition particle subunit SRP54
MVLEELGKGLKSVFSKLLTSAIVDKKTVEELVDSIKKSLIKSDVNLELANKLSQRIKKRAFEEKTPAGMTKREHVLKIVYEELINFLGEKFEPLNLKKKPSVILMVGLLGSGKTTSCAKLARYLQKKGYRVGMICADVYRPASLEQLKQLGERINVPVYGEKNEKDVLKIIRNGLKEFSKKDIIIIDSAGRHRQAEKLMGEMKEIGNEIKPDETILTIDASIGQAAKIQAEAFHKAVPIESIIVTKLDGTAKGGGA